MGRPDDIRAGGADTLIVLRELRDVMQEVAGQQKTKYGLIESLAWVSAARLIQERIDRIERKGKS